ncbi:unnamed protein product [Medioppia subpectinata]|uniref:Peptidase M14 domain-containing protein n=1 Tax=Medioppia subpectinata TaxID=1979941 RepID=A0A7R9KGG8_9ACAR|nr:unnamed protein product [Medioppia subpectinata]CAG2103108.1 unnamed protein product [Medioppia subpectinata]
MSVLKTLIQTENMNGLNIQHNCLLIVKSILSSQPNANRKEKAFLIICDDQLIDNLLLLEDSILGSEPIIETFYIVLTKLSHPQMRALCAPILCTPNTNDILSLEMHSDNGLVNIIDIILTIHKNMSSTSTHAIEVLVVQRLMDPLPLPLDSHFNPNTFDIPLNGESSYKPEFVGTLNGNECNVDETYESSEQSDSDNESNEQFDSQSVSSESDIISYEQYFPEFKDFELNPEFRQKNNTINEPKVNKERKRKLLDSDDRKDNKVDMNAIQEMLKSAKEDKRKDIFMESADWRQVYTQMSAKTISIQPIVTLAEPELAANLGNNKLEAMVMNESEGSWETARTKLMQHITQRNDRKTKEWFVVFDVENGAKTLHKNKLQFESRFESGNLRKQSSLFNEGQRPVMFSTKESLICDKPFWKRVGHSIAYYRNHYLKEDSIDSLMNGKTYYTLTFNIVFPFENDDCFLAFNYPHSYTYLKSCIHFWQNCHNSCNTYFRHQTLCTSLAGNEVPVLTITSSKPPRKETGRQYVVLLGRVHPSETNASWILKGCIDFLLSDKMSAHKLLDNYVFKIVPMSNPDGVINGNSRTGAQGEDLNRQWRRPDPLLHPTVYHMKSLIRYLSHVSNNTNPVILVDFHGHSRRKNIFVYGCCPSMSWKRSDRNKPSEDSSHLAFPLLLESMAPAFSLNSCSYNIEESREPTARITVWRELGLKASYTLECSQAGCDQGLYDGMHLGINELTEMGHKFCSALLKMQFIYDSNTGRPIPVVPNDLLIESTNM